MKIKSRCIFYTLIFIICIFSISCAKDPFNVEGVKLERNINIYLDSNGDVTSKVERVTFTPRITGKGKFQVKVISPDNDLTWEGQVTNGLRFYLDITEGASFPPGDYKLIFYSEDGEDLEQVVSLPSVEKIETIPYFAPYNGFVSYGKISNIIVYNEDGHQTGNKNVADGDTLKDIYSISYSLKDRYLNSINVRQNLIEEI